MSTDQVVSVDQGIGVAAGEDAAALLDTAERCMAALAGQVLTPVGVDDEELAATVGRLAKVAARAQAEKLRRVAELNSRRTDRHPSRQASRLMGWQPGLSRGEARQETATAEALGRLPRTAEQFAAGVIGVARAREAARGLAELDALAAQGREVPEDAATQLDELVAAQPVDADRGQVRRAVDELADRLTPEALAEREARAHAHRRVWVSAPGPDGTSLLEGRLDALGRATLTAALDALSRPSGPADTRTLAQRRHDALVTLAEAALDRGDLPVVAAQRPHVLLTTTADALDGLPAAAPGMLDGYGPTSSATARMVACDGHVTEVVVDANGRPLQIRETGQPTGKQRLAVIARDRVCVGCGAPASRCHLHHIRWRSRNGATVVENLVLVCASCHHAIHHQDWTISTTGDGRYTAKPPTLPATLPGDLRHSA